MRKRDRTLNKGIADDTTDPEEMSLPFIKFRIKEDNKIVVICRIRTLNHAISRRFLCAEGLFVEIGF